MQAKAISINDVWILVIQKYKASDFYYYWPTKKILVAGCVEDDEVKHCYPVIAQSKQVYEGIPLFTPPWVEDVGALASKKIPSMTFINFTGNKTDIKEINKKYLIDGYNLAKEKYRYTEEDMERAIYNAFCKGGFGKKYKEASEEVIAIINTPPTYTVTYEEEGNNICIMDYQKV